MEMHGGNLQHSYGLNNVVGAATDAPLRCSGRVAGSLAPPEEASVPYRDARRGATAAAANRAAREAAVEPCVRVGRTNQEGGGGTLLGAVEERGEARVRATEFGKTFLIGEKRRRIRGKLTFSCFLVDSS